MRVSALKGLAFLYYRAEDRPAALEHLQRALDVDPDDRSVAQALARIAAEPRTGDVTLSTVMPAAAPAAASAPPLPPAAASSPFDGVEGGERGLLLVDANGLRLGGRLEAPDGGDSSDRVAAQLAGVSREAGRATRLLGLGAWHAIAVESPDGHLVLAAPTSDTVLLAAREPSLPLGRVTLLAERAARAARIWLERP
jgi:predicted regulator of Ras-like GTPase activity (Roadblock/LC7/MglB family)